MPAKKKVSQSMESNWGRPCHQFWREEAIKNECRRTIQSWISQKQRGFSSPLDLDAVPDYFSESGKNLYLFWWIRHQIKFFGKNGTVEALNPECRGNKCVEFASCKCSTHGTAQFIDNLVVVIGILIECRRVLMNLWFIMYFFAFSQGKQFREIHFGFHRIF